MHQRKDTLHGGHVTGTSRAGNPVWVVNWTRQVVAPHPRIDDRLGNSPEKDNAVAHTLMIMERYKGASSKRQTQRTQRRHIGFAHRAMTCSLQRTCSAGNVERRIHPWAAALAAAAVAVAATALADKSRSQGIGIAAVERTISRVGEPASFVGSQSWWWCKRRCGARVRTLVAQTPVFVFKHKYCDCV